MTLTNALAYFGKGLTISLAVVRLHCSLCLEDVKFRYSLTIIDDEIDEKRQILTKNEIKR